MHTYFLSLEAIDQATAQLLDAICCHCHASGQLVSHGHVYKKSSSGLPRREESRDIPHPKHPTLQSSSGDRPLLVDPCSITP
ncbi:MAG: hypothetical protein FD130_734 [Halothiobacillaceae bacterium]|nr:MAG: hypothetical protein FD130_734 [Halothiobacillaceae bacterium]